MLNIVIMDSSLINEVNLKIMNSSSGKTKELFIPIIFYDNKNMARNLPSRDIRQKWCYGNTNI